MVSLSEFMAQHALAPGDRIRIIWKGQTLECILLATPDVNKSIVPVKLESGYNTGLSIQSITSVQKTGSLPPHVPPRVDESHRLHAKGKPEISLIVTGGTIGSKVDPTKKGVSAILTPAELLALIPEIGEFADVSTIVSPFITWSGKMGPNDWVRLAQTVQQELNKPSVQGVVLTQGTDTMHYTSAALSFMLPNLKKPVVLTGAQRSSDRGSSDATMNLLCAARMALSDVAEVGICMHAHTSDDYCFFHRGTKVRKLHTSRRDAFQSVNDRPLAKIIPLGEMEWMNDRRTSRGMGDTDLDAVFEEKVALLKVYPGMSAGIIDYYASQGIRGLILEATGLGHTNTDLHPSLKKAIEGGMSIGITSQTLFGRVDLNVYNYGRDLMKTGAFGLEDMLPEVAYVKMGWVLAHTKDPQKVREMMLTNYAGEISPFSQTNAFLE